MRRVSLAVKVGVFVTVISLTGAAVLGVVAIRVTRGRVDDQYRRVAEDLTSIISEQVNRHPDDFRETNAVLESMVATRPDLYRVRLFRGPPYGPPLVWASSYDTDFATDTSAAIITGSHLQNSVEIDGRPAFLDVQPVNYPNGVRAVAFYFRGEARNRTIADTARRIATDAVAVIVVQLVAIIFATYILVLRRIRRLGSAAAAVAGGDLSVRLPDRQGVGVDDELDQVAREFDGMVRAVAARTRQQAAVAELGRRALGGSPLPALFDDAVHLVGDVLETEVVVLFERTEPGLLTLVAAAGLPVDEIQTATTPTGHGSQAGFTLLSGEPVVVVDRNRETRFEHSAFAERHGLVSGVTVVVGTADRAFAVLGANSRHPHTFTDDDISFLQSAANVLAEAIERSEAQARERESEERYRLVVENSADLIVLTDPAGEILFASPAFSSILGHDPTAAVGGRLRDYALHPDSALIQRIARAGVSGRVESFADLTLRHRDGRAVYVMGRAIAVEDDEGEPEFVLLVAHDITDQRAAQEERRRLLGRLMSAQEEERSRIASDIHDDPIQTMTAVALRLQSLRHLSTDAQQLELLDRIEDTVSRAIHRLRRLMFELRPPALDREGLVAALSDTFSDAARESGFTFRLEAHLDTEPDTETRAIAFRIAKEALANITKHSRATLVEVFVASLDGGIRVRIRDDGVGFDPATAEQDPRHIGLASIRERSTLAGGWCNLESSPGEGSTVDFYIPGQELGPRSPEVPTPEG